MATFFGSSASSGGGFRDVLHGVEGTAARARVPHDHDGHGLSSEMLLLLGTVMIVLSITATPAIANVRTLRLLADGCEAERSNRGPELVIFQGRRRSGLEPLGLVQDVGRAGRGLPPLDDGFEGREFVER